MKDHAHVDPGKWANNRKLTFPMEKIGNFCMDGSFESGEGKQQDETDEY